MNTKMQLRRVPVGNRIFSVVQLSDYDVCTPVDQMDWPFRVKSRSTAPAGRLVLDLCNDSIRWELQFQDLAPLSAFGSAKRHVITLSTFASGASFPIGVHAQSFPLSADDFAMLSAPIMELVPRGAVRSLPTVDIAEVIDYPVHGILKISGSADEVAKRVFDLAVNYASLRAFNLIIPPAGSRSIIYFVPRRRAGSAVFLNRLNMRIQVSAIECAGLIQAHAPLQSEDVDAGEISRMFEAVALDESDLRQSRSIINSF